MKPSSEAGDSNLLYAYSEGELQSTQWLHAVYGEVTEQKGARMVIAPRTLSPGISAPQDTVCKEYLTELEAFPREATGLAFVNFSIKEHLRPPGCGGLAVIGAQRVLGEKDHAGRDGPIWKHAVFASAGPQCRAPIALDQATLWYVAKRLHECLSAADENSRLYLASEFARFQGATGELARDILLEHIRRLDPLIEPLPESNLPSFRTRRMEVDAPRGVFYVTYNEAQVGLDQLLEQAAKLTAILYCSDFPWLSVELQCEDRQRDSGSLPGWVVRFVSAGVALNNSSRRTETYDRLFGEKDESLAVLAGRFFAKLGLALESAVEAPVAEYTSLSSPIALRLNEKGLQTIIAAQPALNLSKLAPTTDKLLGSPQGRQVMSVLTAKHHVASSSTPTEQVAVVGRTTEQTSISPLGSVFGSRSPDELQDAGRPKPGFVMTRGPLPLTDQERRSVAPATDRFATLSPEPITPFSWLPIRVRWALTLIWAAVVFAAAVWILVDHAQRIIDPKRFQCAPPAKPTDQPTAVGKVAAAPAAARPENLPLAVAPTAVRSAVQPDQERSKSGNKLSSPPKKGSLQSSVVTDPAKPKPKPPPPKTLLPELKVDPPAGTGSKKPPPDERLIDDVPLTFLHIK